ncbi:MAG: AAC(3) family N-acetyltransferase [Sedimentisphaerales bacterium]
MKSEFVKLLVQKTRQNPISVHIDAVGLLRLASTNDARLSEFSDIISQTNRQGGNIIIPTYSYSYTKNEDYDILHTPSEIGVVTEYLRNKFAAKRTVDALFSYLVFAGRISDKHFEVKDYEPFGDESLIGELFAKDGYVGSIGGVLSYITEVHFLERKLGVSYRYNKSFTGTIIDYSGRKHKQEIVFFCRKPDCGLRPNLLRLEKDMKQDGLVEIFKADGYEFELEAVKIKILYEYIERKIKEDHFYLCSNINEPIPRYDAMAGRKR